MTGVRVALPLGGGQVLLGPIAALLLAHHLADAERKRRLDGLPPPPGWDSLSAAVEQAAEEARKLACESAKARQDARLAGSAAITSLLDPIDASEVARLLGCSPQWARSLCRRREFASAQLRSGGWLVSRDEVLALVANQEGTARARGGHLVEVDGSRRGRKRKAAEAANRR